MKILAIGNSFSQDATALLEFLSPQLLVRNLYIPGCSLLLHSELSHTEKAEYEYQEGGANSLPRKVTLKEGLEGEKWDFVTVQQVSGLSGEESSYYPYLTTLLHYIHAHSDAEIVFHQTWAYDVGCEHRDFVRYEHSREVMWQKIEKTISKVSAKEDLSVIRSGELIERLRRHAFFDPLRGGLSLCRDGYHLSYNYGRCAAAAAWTKFFTGETPAFLLRNNLSEGYRLIADEVKLL